MHFDSSDCERERKKCLLIELDVELLRFYFPLFIFVPALQPSPRALSSLAPASVSSTSSCLLYTYAKRTLMRFIYSAAHFAVHIFVCAFIAEHNIRNCFKIICSSGYFKCRFFVETLWSFAVDIVDVVAVVDGGGAGHFFINPFCSTLSFFRILFSVLCLMCA